MFVKWSDSLGYQRIRWRSTTLYRRMQGRGDFLDEKVGSILMDLGYTKTRHHDKYVHGSQRDSYARRISSPSGMKRCTVDVWHASSILVWKVLDLDGIFNCIEASPKVIYPALKEYSMSLRPENIKSHLQVISVFGFDVSRSTEAIRRQIS